MEDRKRTVLAVLIAVVLMVALLYSFGLNLFSHVPQLDLADPNAVESQEPGSTAPVDAAGITVAVAPNTVQSVIASLSRYESYSRTITVSYYWGDSASESMTAQVWADDGWVRTETLLASGLTEFCIVGENRIWLWYDGDSDAAGGEVYEGSIGGLTVDGLQHIPTYEDVLALDAANITNAGYVEYNDQSCIYVESEQQELGYLYRYWVSVTSGLLMGAETEKSGMVVYRMDSNNVTSPMEGGRQTFALPDGTVLHSVD